MRELLPSEKIERNYRHLIGPQEVDLYLPEKKIAIEFNGLYWHSEAAGRGRRYHLEKLEAVEATGVRLLTVWEDDWSNKREIVQSFLKNKLGVDDRPRVSARSCKVTIVPRREARKFLEESHLQGFAGATLYLGLELDGEIVALLSLKKVSGVWQIVRYASTALVRGGFSKLLATFFKKEGPVPVTTWSDRLVSDGGLYRSLGFVEDGILPPDYSYLVDGERKHKFGYRLKRFREDPNLLFEEGLTERELASLNGLERVWDAGKVRWLLSR